MFRSIPHGNSLLRICKYGYGCKHNNTKHILSPKPKGKGIKHTKKNPNCNNNLNIDGTAYGSKHFRLEKEAHRRRFVVMMTL